MYLQTTILHNNTAQPLFSRKGNDDHQQNFLACREKLRWDRSNLQHGCPFDIFLVHHFIDRIAHKRSQSALGFMHFWLSTLYTENLVNLTVF